MANSHVFDPPISAGQRVSSTALNALDDGQVNAMVRNGESPLTADSAIILNGHDLLILGTGGGQFKPDADFTEFTGTGWPALETRNVSNWAPPCGFQFDPAGFVATLSASHVQIASLYYMRFVLSLPTGVAITAVRLPVMRGSTGSGLPGTMPNISLDYMTSAGAFTNVGSAVDTSANEAAYEAFHNISLTGLNHTVALGRRYFLTLTGDSASSSTANGLQVWQPFVDLTVTSMRVV